MKNQMRVLSLLIFSILFFVLLVSCVRSSDVEAPSNSPSFDFYTYSFFNLFPPFNCSAQQSNNSLSNLQTQNYYKVIESIFGLDFPFNHVADMPDFRRLLEKDPGPEKLLRGISDDVDLKDLIEHANKVLFGDSIKLSVNSSPLLNKGVPDGPKCTDAMAGRGECGTDVAGDKNLVTSFLKTSQTNPPLAILVCILYQIKRTEKNPQNLGSIMCNCARMVPGGIYLCPFLEFLSKTLACTEPSKCPPIEAKPYVPPEDARYANLPMIATLPTQSQIEQKTINSERQTYYLLAKSLALLSYDAEQAACDPHYKSASTISGWNIEMTVNLIERKDEKPGAKTPFARLSSRPTKGEKTLTDFLITVRGAKTTAEWGVDFSYNKIPVQLSPTDLVPVHHGFASLASTIWGAFQPHLQKAFDNGTLGIITITGFSLGGGVASILGAFASKQFGVYLPDGYSARTRVVAFGANRSGGLDAGTVLSKVVAMRSLEAAFDPVPQFPCNSMLSCPANLVPVPTGRDFSSNITYFDTVGLVPIKEADLPVSYSKNATVQFSAWHFCAYDCWTSFQVDPAHLALCLTPREGKSVNPNQICFDLS